MKLAGPGRDRSNDGEYQPDVDKTALARVRADVEPPQRLVDVASGDARKRAYQLRVVK